MNKPYIWMDDLGTWFTNEDYQNLDNKDKKGIFPLYTHPMRELRGDEIRTVIDEHWEKTSNVNLFDFARAILKKASEK
jgi:hypothetical protein